VCTDSVQWLCSTMFVILDYRKCLLDGSSYQCKTVNKCHVACVVAYIWHINDWLIDWPTWTGAIWPAANESRRFEPRAWQGSNSQDDHVGSILGCQVQAAVSVVWLVVPGHHYDERRVAQEGRKCNGDRRHDERWEYHVTASSPKGTRDHSNNTHTQSLHDYITLDYIR